MMVLSRRSISSASRCFFLSGPFRAWGGTNQHSLRPGFRR
jgi:hypothetical protein